MDAVKAKPYQVNAVVKPTPSTYSADNKPKPEANADKKAAEQALRPTTNTRGEALGQHLNVKA
jgi:hypothetical protein